MSSATVTSKGQITIPIDVRSTLGLQPGSRINFVLAESGVFEIRVHAASLRELKGAISPPTVPVSLDDMDDAVADGAAGLPR